MKIKTKNPAKEFSIFLWGGVAPFCIAVLAPFFAVGSTAFGARAFFLHLIRT
jgi:hypothetical protein